MLGSGVLGCFFVHGLMILPFADCCPVTVDVQVMLGQYSPQFAAIRVLKGQGEGGDGACGVRCGRADPSGSSKAREREETEPVV
jgi:hypothetical protein